MKEKILIVDDEENVLYGIKRQLRGNFNIFLAGSGKEALDVLRSEKHFALVITDYKMPEMNGLELLQQVHKISPETITMMLTGQADFENIIDIINRGQIFRFLTKPCAPKLLVKNIEDGIRQYRLVNSEKELLSKTLNGVVKLLMEMLSFSRPVAFNRTVRIRKMVDYLLDSIRISDPWKVELATMLSHVGFITLPEEMENFLKNPLHVSETHREPFNSYITTGAELLEKIPRLEGVAEIIRNQNYKEMTPEVPIGSLILRLAIDYDNYELSGLTTNKIVEKMEATRGRYDEDVFKAFQNIINKNKLSNQKILLQTTIDKLQPGMYFGETVVSQSGVTVANKGQLVTQTQITTLQNYFRQKQIASGIKVFVIKQQ